MANGLRRGACFVGHLGILMGLLVVARCALPHMHYEHATASAPARSGLTVSACLAPAASQEIDDGRARNRRVELVAVR